MTTAVTALKLYVEDRVLRRATDSTMRALASTARRKGAKPRRWMIGATLISQDDLTTYVNNYRRLLKDKRGESKTYEQWVDVVMNRPTFKPVHGNYQYFLRLRPVYDPVKREIILESIDTEG